MGSVGGGRGPAAAWFEVAAVAGACAGDARACTRTCACVHVARSVWCSAGRALHALWQACTALLLLHSAAAPQTRLLFDLGCSPGVLMSRRTDAPFQPSPELSLPSNREKTKDHHSRCWARVALTKDQLNQDLTRGRRAGSAIINVACRRGPARHMLGSRWGRAICRAMCARFRAAPGCHAHSGSCMLALRNCQVSPSSYRI